MTNRLTSLLALSALTLMLAAPGAAVDRMGDVEVDWIRRLVFAPDMVIRHQRLIGLTPEQRQELISEMQATQADLVPLRIEMSDVAERLGEALRAARVDEAAALALTEEILGLEAQIKRRHMTLLLRIKNLLTEEQQRALYRIKRQRQEMAQERR